MTSLSLDTKVKLTMLRRPLNRGASKSDLGKFLQAMWRGMPSGPRLQEMAEESCCAELLENYRAEVKDADIGRLDNLLLTIKVLGD